MRSRIVRMIGAAAIALLTALGASAHDLLHEAEELSLGSLEPLPADSSNRFADDERAADLGHRLFFDARLSSNGQVSCATCHDPARQFQDGTALAKGVGSTARRTMPITATAYAPYYFWDGRKDSQWAQALGPLESLVEHGGTREQYAHVIADHYRDDYERIFGPMPDLRGNPRESATAVFVNIGKAIAAYERRIRFAPSRFDRFVSQWKATGKQPKDILTNDEIAGLTLFTHKANCVQCHNGPLFTNYGFHNTGVPVRAGLADDHGRRAGIANVKGDEFNCRSRWSDAGARDCLELAVLPTPGPAHERAFKVPSLRNVAERAPYMHAGQYATLAEVLDHYNRAPAAPSGHSELKPLNLSRDELRQLEAFLHSLSGPLDAPAKYLRAPQESHR
ncbi:MAG: cytochrome-c peroxidase [Usitatibacter sp.]